MAGGNRQKSRLQQGMSTAGHEKELLSGGVMHMAELTPAEGEEIDAEMPVASYFAPASTAIKDAENKGHAQAESRDDNEEMFVFPVEIGGRGDPFANDWRTVLETFSQTDCAFRSC
eukprot:3271677-Rhodomonas_salina.1